MSDYLVLANHAGVDEAGRGCLVGSVFAAAVILPETFVLPGLTDSKKLSEKKRDILAEQIKQQAVAWHIASASVQEILQYNILHATMLAMTRAIEGLTVPPEKVWIDGNRIPKNLTVHAQAVVLHLFWQRPRAMRRCMPCINVIHNTVLISTKAMAQQHIWQH